MSAKFQTRYDERIKAPSFEEIDRKDPVAFKAARDRWNLERLIELEIVKIYRDRVTECHRREEVNARQNCRKVVSDYMKAFTNPARQGLTSVIRREPVFSLWYGRRREKGEKI